jgi:hypothetical protein|tara:strand:+ start:517 stop:810 length:294 start_codon:yes stop_codon:yes gene_type:complete
MDNEEKIKEMEEKISNLETELQATKEHLKKYTSPIQNKIYYERNKDKHKQMVKEYKEKTNYFTNLSSEKKKEYARQAYLNKKEKIKKLKEKQEDENV